MGFIFSPNSCFSLHAFTVYAFSRVTTDTTPSWDPKEFEGPWDGIAGCDVLYLVEFLLSFDLLHFRDVQVSPDLVSVPLCALVTGCYQGGPSPMLTTTQTLARVLAVIS